MKFHIVLDTNVLISAILFGGKPEIILEKVQNTELECYLSPEILSEFRGVLSRPKFKCDKEMIYFAEEQLKMSCTIVFPKTKLNVIKDDPDDNRILECAIEAKANYIISGDPHLLKLNRYKKIEIVNPANFLELLSDSSKQMK